jgi:hypothetical protein
MTKATPNVIVKDGPEGPPIVSMISPGRRALGEDWSRVDIMWDADERKYVAKREDAPAPADGKPIFIPSLGNVSMEIMDYLIEEQQKEAEYRARSAAQGVRQRQEEEHERINRLWHQWIETKLKAFKGQSIFGPGGHTQREKVVHRG